VDELLEYHSPELANEDLLKMGNNMNDDSQEPLIFAEPIKQLSTKQIIEFFKHTDSAIRIIEENDPNETRSTKVAREIQNYLVCYKELYRERKNAARQLSLHCFIKKVEDHQPVIRRASRERESDDPDPVPSCVRSM
jgi:hypothetical protein